MNLLNYFLMFFFDFQNFPMTFLNICYKKSLEHFLQCDKTQIKKKNIITYISKVFQLF